VIAPDVEVREFRAASDGARERQARIQCAQCLAVPGLPQRWEWFDLSEIMKCGVPDFAHSATGEFALRIMPSSSG
jgi:hypothetical protein